MIVLTVGEFEKNKNGLLCVVFDDEEGMIEQRPLGSMFKEFILELQSTEDEDVFNHFAEKIKSDLQLGIDFIERLQIPVGSNSTH